MKKVILVLLTLVLSTITISSQTTLSAGDIAIVGINCDTPDDFAFVLLTDITTNTLINFTDNGWLASGSFRSGEGTIAYTSPSNQTAGTVIIYSVSSADFSSVSGSFSLALAGDQIIAFQGTIASPTLIYALNDDGAGVWQSDATSSNNSALPTGLTNGVSAVALNEIDNAYYSGGANSDLNALRLAISDNSNWTGDDTTPYTFSSIFTGPLPVELSSFSASVIGNGVKLNWRTETEVNNHGFEILRSAQDDEWDVIGFVEGYGNSNSPKEYSFMDENITGGKYSYRLKQIDNDGKFEYSKIVEVEIGSPIKFELAQNYPNPFNPTTTINFSLPEKEFVNLSVYNILGEKVATLLNENKEAGVYSVNFNADELNSGIYFYKLETSNFTQIKKMMLVK